MSEKVFDILAVIAVRKSKFYEKSRDKLLEQLPSYVDHKEVRKQLRKAIAELDDSLFIGEVEKSKNTIDPSIPIEKLGLDQRKIVDEVIKKLSS